MIMMKSCAKSALRWASLSASLLVCSLAMAGTRIDINRADVKALSQVKGVGLVRANAIVAYRKAHGPFKQLDALVNVKGFGKKSVSKLRDKLVVRSHAQKRTRRPQ